MSRRNQGITLFEERFCQLMALGHTARESYCEAFGFAVTDTRSQHQADNRASRLAKKPEIAARIVEAAGEAKRANRRKWEERGEDLAQRIYDSIIAADEAGELLKGGALKGVEVLAKLKGLNAPDETVLRNGGMAEDAYVPAGVERMSEEDLRAIIDREERTVDAEAVDVTGN